MSRRKKELRREYLREKQKKVGRGLSPSDYIAILVFFTITFFFSIYILVFSGLMFG